MENQHRKIAGYRELTPDEIDLMNEVKSLGLQIKMLCDKVDAHVIGQRQVADEQELRRLELANPEHWVRWARDSMQANLMYLTRAVAQPTNF